MVSIEIFSFEYCESVEGLMNLKCCHENNFFYSEGSTGGRKKRKFRSEHFKYRFKKSFAALIEEEVRAYSHTCDNSCGQLINA